jgi:putative nucleotidyltransferase with HDIG domain
LTKIDELLDKVDALPPFPAVVQKAIGLLSDPLVSAERLVEIVRYDQSITANVIRMCNSALLSPVNPVSTLKDALVRIGNRELVRIILSAGGTEMLRAKVEGYDMAEGDLWKHSILCALLAEDIGENMGLGKPEKAFTAGLLHDIGKIVLGSHVGEAYREICQAQAAWKTTFSEAEIHVLGMSHAEAGGRIAEKWNFDADMANAIRYHHAPSEGNPGPLLFLVHLSDVLCLTSGMGGGADGLRYNVDFDLLQSKGVGPCEFEMGLVRLAEVEKRFRGIVAMYG